MPIFKGGHIYNDRGGYIGRATPGQSSEEALAAHGLRLDTSNPLGVTPIDAPPAGMLAQIRASEERMAALVARAEAAAAPATTDGEARDGE